MLKDFILFIKYPYTAGVIATIWLGSAILMAINRDFAGHQDRHHRHAQ